MRATIVAGCLAVLPALAGAQALPMTVAEMNRACGMVAGGEGAVGAESAVAVGVCFGLMRGVVQVMQANCRSVGMGRQPAAALTVGEIPTSGHAIRAFADWAEANPNEADSPAAYGVITALAEAFPCGS